LGILRGIRNMMTKTGERVGAICNSDKATVRFFGFGVFDGDKEPPSEVSIMGISVGELNKEIKEDCKKQGREYTPFTNPRITLDSGKVVWGCQCWWGSEEKVKKMLEGKEVIMVNIDEEMKDNG
jgi:hypothetical protein